MAALRVHMLWVVLLMSSQLALGQDHKKLAASAYAKGNYPEAIKNYKKLLFTDSRNSEYNHRIGVSYLLSNSDKSKAIQHLEEAERDENYDKEVIYHLARAYHMNYEFDRATETYFRYQQESGSTDPKVDRHIGNCYSAKELMTDPLEVSFINLGPEINSVYPDFSPFVTSNEDLLVFTSRRSGTKEFDGLYPSNIYMSTKIEGKYKEAVSVGATVNSDYDEQAVGLSADGKTLFVYFDHVTEFGDIYECRRTHTNFVAPERVNSAINSESLETAGTISPDGNTLFFASNRPGGFGGLDIYMTRKLPDGSWALAQNLGRSVNTQHNEDDPIPAPDGKGIYFSSRGHANLGGYDLFYSEWGSDWNTFKRPKNLGYPINTPEDNRTISFSASGKFAYIAAIRGEGLGDLDIYKVIFDAVDPIYGLLQFTIEGNENDNKLISDTLYIRGVNQEERPFKYLPNQDGVYSVILKRGQYKIWLNLEKFKLDQQLLTLDEYDLYPAIRKETLTLVLK